MHAAQGPRTRSRSYTSAPNHHHNTQPRSPHPALETSQPQPQPHQPTQTATAYTGRVIVGTTIVTEAPTPTSQTPQQGRHRGTGRATRQQHPSTSSAAPPPTEHPPHRDPAPRRAAEIRIAPRRCPPLQPQTGGAAGPRRRGRSVQPQDPDLASQRSRAGRHRDRTAVPVLRVSGRPASPGAGRDASPPRSPHQAFDHASAWSYGALDPPSGSSNTNITPFIA